jgi:hypothetical protein
LAAVTKLHHRLEARSDATSQFVVPVYVSIIWREISLPPAFVDFLHGLLFDPEDGDVMFL